MIPFPAEMPPPSRYSLGLLANTQSGGRSPFTGTEQTLELPGARWAAELSWSNLDESEWRYMQAWLANVGGRAGRLTWSPVTQGAQPRRGTGAGAGVVHGVGQQGRTIITRGWAANVMPWMPGDLIGWNDPNGRPQMHVVTGPERANAQGRAATPIAPPIRRSPLDGTAVTSTPLVVWRLGEDFNPLSFAGHTVLSDVSIKIEEALFG